ncbi:hypothetical protein I302_105814 [Kwoniella bestiolae CBS 10118]|uniref:Uncharacterized protein n=1 Tax=Kwoniella bestiolae CBS 10118 TaxID=1296100 RepID=A0A1B9G278_9TREE|nr:hypothetical protein I302_04936 [Kwoniella bestiolae CBS 10118]OCF25126.1 hypothetical protein I302_04936 [Kwoniella bestiolae CBS 10118]
MPMRLRPRPGRIRPDIHIPNDIILRIALFCYSPTLLPLMRVSWTVYAITSPLLYRSIEIDDHNAPLVFTGLPLPAKVQGDQREEGKGSKKKEGTKKEKEVWPDVALISEDEAEAPNTKIKKINSKKSNYIPDAKSEERKLDLFRYTTSLKMGCRPPTWLSKALIEYAQQQKSVDEGFVMFPNLERIIITGTAVKQWANRQDRLITAEHMKYLIKLDLDHLEDLCKCKLVDDPFTLLVKIIGRPKHLCITLPQYTQEDHRNFLEERCKATSISRKNLKPDVKKRWEDRFGWMVKDITAQIPDEFHIRKFLPRVQQTQFLRTVADGGGFEGFGALRGLDGKEEISNFIIRNVTTGVIPFGNEPDKIFFTFPIEYQPAIQKRDYPFQTPDLEDRYGQLRWIIQGLLSGKTLDLMSVRSDELTKERMKLTRRLLEATSLKSRESPISEEQARLNQLMIDNHNQMRMIMGGEDGFGSGLEEQEDIEDKGGDELRTDVDATIPDRLSRKMKDTQVIFPNITNNDREWWSDLVDALGTIYPFNKRDEEDYDIIRSKVQLKEADKDDKEVRCECCGTIGGDLGSAVKKFGMKGRK